MAVITRTYPIKLGINRKISLTVTFSILLEDILTIAGGLECRQYVENSGEKMKNGFDFLEHETSIAHPRLN